MDFPKVKGYDFKEEEVAKALKDNKLLLLNIFTSNKCNLKCPYCFTKDHNKSQKLTLEEYKRIILDARELGAESVWWVGSGEPFLYDQWRELVNYTTELGLWLGIFTNGTIINRNDIKYLKSKNVSLYVKMNSFKRDIQNKLVGGIEKTYEKIQKTLGNLLDANFQEQNRLAIETVITKFNYKEIPKIFKWARDNDIIPFIEMMEHANDAAKKLDIPLENHKELFERLLETDKEGYDNFWVAQPPWVAYRCINIYISLAIDGEGNITPCSGLTYKIGNIKDNDLKFWWNHPKAKFFRNPEIMEPAKGKIGYYGCKSHTYHITGKLNVPDPRLNHWN